MGDAAGAPMAGGCRGGRGSPLPPALPCPGEGGGAPATQPRGGEGWGARSKIRAVEPGGLVSRGWRPRGGLERDFMVTTRLRGES